MYHDTLFLLKAYLIEGFNHIQYSLFCMNNTPKKAKSQYPSIKASDNDIPIFSWTYRGNSSRSRSIAYSLREVQYSCCQDARSATLHKLNSSERKLVHTCAKYLLNNPDSDYLQYDDYLKAALPNATRLRRTLLG